MQSDGAGNQDGTVFSRTSLHPGSANDSQVAFPPLQPRVGFTARLWGSPLTPGAVFSKSTSKKEKKPLSQSSFLPPPSTDCTQNNGLFSCASLHYGACGLAVQRASDFNHMYCTQIKRVSPGSTAA
ncbi:hypothetical protein KUCAC02_004980 [Chaenocephalus aceratus]|uniref:Uncharacterized protein n=2 Tax=Chaenocephalus aceratus TaxID=36190 RepID=A0ACB9X075_CHAAC|nr:hypothetical protein KUCAC02_004977 [Chaenocephalus aceratus]KAI4819744.1 hypothetical protein KUCAC02_004980 [Chaenocephalus aceratus]